MPSNSSTAEVVQAIEAPTEALATRADRYYEAAEERKVPFLEWSLRIPEPKSGTLDFERFPYQLQMYKDFASGREQVIMKAVQVGVSALLARWAMFGADTHGFTVLYVFPTERHLFDFSDTRFMPMIEGSRYLVQRVPPGYVQNKGLKHIGTGWLYGRGSETKRALDSVDADWLALDEYDTLAADNIPDAERRISASLDPHMRRVGVPSHTGFGISKLYTESDQREWHVTCGVCGLRQPLDFWKNVDQERELRVCRDCREPLDVAVGEWIAKYPGREIIGWHVSKLIVPGADLRVIIRASKERDPSKQRVFYNKDLGLPYEEEEGRLSLEALQAAQSAGDYNQGPWDADLGTPGSFRTMGVDVASRRALNVRISEHSSDRTKRALFIGTVDNFTRLVELMNIYKVNMAGIDHAPEGRLARGFANRFPGRVYLIHYATQEMVLKVNDTLRQAGVKRVEAIDATLQMVREQRNLLPHDLPEDYMDQLRAIRREVTEAPNGAKTVKYVSDGPDDFAHAEVYDLVAGELWQYRQMVEKQESQETRQLDDLTQVDRSSLDDPLGYSEGPDWE